MQPGVMPIFQDQKTAKGRTIALYPGAFRPPHAAHYIAVRHLLALSKIDKVVVIISNRCRPIPGTTLALDPTIAQRIWSIYLQGTDKIQVEVASHTAVGHALEYFDRVEVGDTLLFCLGETDISQGDDRFRNLKELAKQSGIQATVIQAPTGSIQTRSTSLRAALTQGDTGREDFFSALPTHLTHKQRAEVWVVCREGMRDMGDVIKEKVHADINRLGLGDIEDLRSTVQGKMNQVFRVRFKNGRCLLVKYAGDAVGNETLGQRMSLKPRERLSVERKALKWLRANTQSNIELPEIVHFEKKTWTLVLSEVCPGGNRLQDDLKMGTFDPIVASRTSQFLAECHTIAKQAPALWGEIETDRQHWKKMLELRTVESSLEKFPKDIQKNLATLKLASENAEENRFVNLDFHPKNIFIHEDKIGVIDFELSSSVGDPAFDLGYFLGHYVYWILTSSVGNSWQEAIQSALHAYQQGVGALWQRMDLRVVSFTGATLLNILAREEFRPNRDLASNVMQAGTFLLAQGLKQRGNPDRILCAAINHFSA
jgi:aminoglycoside phosphotransferase (APT) family kinase protein